MAHGITKTDHMAYAGQTPWHEIGTPVKDTLTPEEMAEAAKLGWTIEVAPLRFIGLDLKEHTVPQRVMFRSDTLDVLDVVGPKYVPAQNAQILAFFREYVKTGDMKLDTAGSLWGGRWVWGLAKLKDGFTLCEGDTVKGHLLVANPNRYGSGIVVKFVAERVVCHNTLTTALGEKDGRTIVIAHDREFDEPAREDAARRIGLARDSVATFKAEALKFAETKFSDKQVTRVISKTFRVSLNNEEQFAVDKRVTKRIKELYHGQAIGAALPSAAGTAWGLLNAVTQYVDH